MMSEKDKRIAELEAELEQAKRECIWQEIHVTARTASRNYFMQRTWKAEAENAKLHEDSGLSLKETETLFGAKGMNAAQQGAELLCRGKRIEQLEAEIEKAKAHLVSVIAQRDGFVSQRNDFFAELESQDAEIEQLHEVAVLITEIWEDVVASHALCQKAYTSPEDKYMQVLGEAICALSKILHKERE